MTIKLIGLDLDRTTLNKNHRISERTKKALEGAAAKGVHVVIATGRSFYSMPQDVYEVKGLEFTANSNGAEVRNLKDKEVIYRNCIDQGEIDSIYDYLKKDGNIIEVFTDGRAYIDAEEFAAIRDFKKPFRARDYVLSTRTPVEDIYQFLLNHRDAIENINIFYENQDDKTAAWEEMKSLKNVTITSSMKDNIEIGGMTTSKADALKYLASKFNISHDEIMVCGDSPNDSAMMELAGVKVAVANASDDIKALANFHTDHHDDDGVAKAIEKLVLNK